MLIERQRNNVSVKKHYEIYESTLVNKKDNSFYFLDLHLQEREQERLKREIERAETEKRRLGREGKN